MGPPENLLPETRLKYKEFSPHIEVSFWYELERRKLHEWRLNEPTVPVTLFGAVHTVVSSSPANAVSLRRESFGNDAAATASTIRTGSDEAAVPISIPTLINGQLLNFNTAEQLQRLPRREALWRVLREHLLLPLSGIKHDAETDDDDNVSSNAIEKAWETVNFSLAAVFTYANLKTHCFHYALAFPVLDLGAPVHVVRRITGGFNAVGDGSDAYFPSRAAVEAVHASLLGRLRQYPERGPNPFLVILQSHYGSNEVNTKEIVFESFTPSGIARASAASAAAAPSQRLIIVFADPSTMEECPGWPARNIVAAFRLARPETTSFVLYCIRHADPSRSILFDCACDAVSYTLAEVAAAVDSRSAAESLAGGSSIKSVGWAASSLHSVDLSAMMDPERLAESSARLNLYLMKWRMMPNLQLGGLERCRALLLGSGTLGCNVARHLLMWGVTHITLVDRGCVSYSNPVRQTLFEMADVTHPCEEERNKARAAARALRRILPCVCAQGIMLNIHMPGHRVDEEAKATAAAEIERLDELIRQHDVIFLLTDSREARWLPTVIAAAHDKPILNAALGFDTYVVMRHGVAAQPMRSGCYFCSDIVAPRDSMTARTLDQQCTVTRPGVSGIAAATAVELLAQLYNHPQGFASPPYTEKDDNNNSITHDEDSRAGVCILGNIPHQIRGSVAGHYVYNLHGYQYEFCTACSKPVVEAYRLHGTEFVLQCVNDPLYIEEVCGLRAFKESSGIEDLAEWDADSVSEPVGNEEASENISK